MARRITAACAALAAFASPLPAAAEPLYGFTTFPSAATQEAVDKTLAVIREGASVFALHFDHCVPWSELAAGKPLPRAVEDDWNRQARAVPAGMKVYVALGLLATDRKSLAPDCSGNMPGALKGAALDSDAVKHAYGEYVRRAVERFHPAFLNVAIEVSGVAAHTPDAWPGFADLFLHLRGQVQRQSPSTEVGFSVGLQTLMKPDVAKLAKPLIEQADYLGLSFYPSASAFGEKFGEPKLGEGAERWTRPLAWAKAYTSKPLALTETGFTSRDAHLPRFDLTLRGTQEEQAAYAHDLIAITRQDDYRFVIWYLTVDYDQLYASMPEGEAKEVSLLWRNIGLHDGEGRPKPAWREWLRWKQAALPPTTAAPAVPVKAAPVQQPAAIAIGFGRDSDLFGCGSGATQLDPDGPAGAPSMRWDFTYTADWQWCARELHGDALANSRGVTFWVRSDREGGGILNLELNNGELFYHPFPITASWTEITLPYTAFTAEPGKRREGVLRPEKLAKLVLVDPAGRENAAGSRSIGFARFGFY